MEFDHWICVIDLFGVSYDGTLPSIALACDETWLGLFCGGSAQSSRCGVSSRRTALSCYLKTVTVVRRFGRSIERCAGNKSDWTSRQPDLSFRL